MSKLASRQLLLWADGELSAARLQQTMQDAIDDGLAHPMVLRMSQVGQAQHAHHGFMDMLTRHTAALDNISPIAGAVGDAASHILLPSTILRSLSRFYPGEFRRRLGADRGLLESFWGQYKQRWLAVHPILNTMTRDQLAYTIPLTIHEDAGPITKKSSANCISFASLLAEGNEKLTHFLCVSYIKKVRAEGVDNAPMWQALLADLEALCTGAVNGRIVAPVEPDGHVGWRFVILFAKADEQVRCDDWGLPHYNAAHECCSECLANRSTRPWTDMRLCAAWRGAEDMDLATYRARVPAPRPPG